MDHKAPSFQFYPKDWVTDINVCSMTNAEQGIYFVLLCHDWLEDGLTKEQIDLFISRLNQPSPLVEARFVVHPRKEGYLTNPRLEKEREKQINWAKKSSEAGKKSGEARKKLAISKLCESNQGLTNHEPNTNSSTSIPSSTSINNIKKEKVYKVFNVEDFSFGKLWGDKAKDALKRWIEFKTAAGHGKLLISYQNEINTFELIPKEYAKLADRAITQGWKGLNANVAFETPKVSANGFHKPEPQGRPQPEMFKDDMKKYPDLTPEEAAKSKALLNDILFSKIKTI